MEIAKKKVHRHQECTKSHEPNEVTKQALENVKNRKGLQKATIDFDGHYINAIESLLSEWNSTNDEEDYKDL